MPTLRYVKLCRLDTHTICVHNVETAKTRHAQFAAVTVCFASCASTGNAFASSLLCGEAEEHWGDGIQIPDLDPFFAFGMTSAGGRRITIQRMVPVALAAAVALLCGTQNTLALPFDLLRAFASPCF